MSAARALMSSAPTVEMREAVIGYGSVPVTERVDLSLQPGECFGIVGANGAGKTSLLRAITGEARVFHGDVLFHGRSMARVSGWRRARMGVSFVPEGRRLFTELTVGDNVASGALMLRKRERQSAEATAYEVFPQLQAFRNRRASALSGGEQQMLAIARAIAGAPNLILLDEPSLGLSPRAVSDLTAALRKVAAAGRTTILVVEQSLVIVRALCNRSAIMQLGRLETPGVTEQVLSEEAIREGFLR